MNLLHAAVAAESSPNPSWELRPSTKIAYLLRHSSLANLHVATALELQDQKKNNQSRCLRGSGVEEIKADFV